MIENLKKLVFEGGYDETDKREVLRLESELQEVAAAERLADNPIIRKFIDYLDTQAQQCTMLLSNDRTLTDIERRVIFEKRDICEHFTELFTGQKKEAIEAQVKSLLDVAKNN